MISFSLAGLFYRNDDAKEEADLLSVGDTVKLRLDTYNESGEFAVKIISNGKFIGYVERLFSRDVTLFILRNKKYIAMVYDVKTMPNFHFGDDDLIISFNLYSDNEQVIKFSDEWYSGKNILIDGIFDTLNKNDIEYFIKKYGGIVQKRINSKTDAIVIGQHHISENRIEAIHHSLNTKKPIIAISEEEMINHFEGKYHFFSK